MKTLKEQFCELIIEDGYLRLRMPNGDLISDASITINSLESSVDDKDKTIKDRKYRLAHAVIELPILIKI